MKCSSKEGGIIFILVGLLAAIAALVIVLFVLSKAPTSSSHARHYMSGSQMTDAELIDALAVNDMSRGDALSD